MFPLQAKEKEGPKALYLREKEHLDQVRCTFNVKYIIINSSGIYLPLLPFTHFKENVIILKYCFIV